TFRRRVLPTRDGLQQPLVGRRVPQAREECVEIGSRLVFGRNVGNRDRRRPAAHFFGSRIDTSALFSIRSTTRQLAHICSCRSAPSPANIEWVPSLPSIASIICRVPNGLPQRTQLNGSATFSTVSCLACGASSSRGTSESEFSGQVAT